MLGETGCALQGAKGRECSLTHLGFLDRYCLDLQHRFYTYRCHLIFYCTSYRLNMFQALLCPSSGARDYDVVYHIGRFVLGLLYVGGKVLLGRSRVRAEGSSL